MPRDFIELPEETPEERAAWEREAPGIIPGVRLLMGPFIVHYNKCLDLVFDRYFDAWSLSGLNHSDYAKQTGPSMIKDLKEVYSTFIAMLSAENSEAATEISERLHWIWVRKLARYTNDLAGGAMRPRDN